MLGALEAYAAGQYETAADRFRQAGKLGCRDRRLGGMLLSSLFNAGRQVLASKSEAPLP
jgi:hypothetical protein